MARVEGINRERLIREFVRLTEFDSESFHERDIADYLKGRLEELGLKVEEDDTGSKLAAAGYATGEKPAGNIYARLESNTGDDTEPVLLSAHLDTVKPGKNKKAIQHEDGLITSDGTTVLGADDAAGLAEILEALTVIKEKNLSHGLIEVVLPVAEEPYAQGSKVFDYDKLQAKTAYVLDLSGPVGRAATAAPAIISVSIEVKGKAAHAGFCPEEGVHAILIAAKAIARIKQGHIHKDTTVNIGTISGGTAANIVPDSVKITGEIRSMDNEAAEREADRIVKVFQEEADSHGGEVSTEVRVQFKAYRIEDSEPVVKKFKAACGELGLGGTLTETFGGSDNNHFAAHGIRGLVVANAMNEVHTVKEWTSTDELARAAELTLRLATEDR